MNKNRVAIYCRLSKDDEQIGDSVSIETQKMLLTGYCINQDFEIVDTYIDDGFSGLNFNRPSFRRMINDIEDGKNRYRCYKRFKPSRTRLHTNRVLY